MVTLFVLPSVSRMGTQALSRVQVLHPETTEGLKPKPRLLAWPKPRAVFPGNTNGHLSHMLESDRLKKLRGCCLIPCAGPFKRTALRKPAARGFIRLRRSWGDILRPA